MQEEDSFNIRVLLVDDMSLILEGWGETLLQVEDFYIVGEIHPRQLLTEIAKSHVDIVLANISLLAKTHKKSKIIQSVKELNSHVKVVLTVENDKERRLAQHAGADEAILKPFRRNDLINLLQGLSRDDKRLCNYYARMLLEIDGKPENAERYESLITGVLRIIFQSACQIYSDDDAGIRSKVLLFPNLKNGDFWKFLNDKHQVDFIFCWVQNINRLGLPLMQTISDRLANNTGSFGIIIIRSGDSSQIVSLQNSIRNNNGKILLVLTDKEIRSLLSHRAAGVDCNHIFEEAYHCCYVEIRP